MRKTSESRRSFVGALAAASLAGKSAWAQTASPPSTGAPIPIRIAWIPGSHYRLPVAIARDLLTKHGLKAELIRFTSGPAMNAAFKSGGVDIGMSGPPGVLTIMSTGAPIKAFMLDNDVSTSDGLVVVPGSGIETIKDLKGKSIAMPRGTVVWVTMIRALKQNGMTLNDVKVVDMGVGPIMAAFKNRDVQAAWVWAPPLFDLQEMGGKEIVRDSVFGSASNYWFGRSSWVDANQVAVERYIAAMDEATSIHKANPAATAKLLSEYLNVGLGSAQRVLNETRYWDLEEMVLPSGNASMLSETSGAKGILREFAEILNANGILREMPDLSNVIDAGPLQRYLKTKKR